MPRTIPSGLQIWLNNYPLLESHSTMSVYLPYSENADTFYYATLPLVIDGNEYNRALKSIGELKMSMGRAADRVEVRISNEDGLQGGIFTQSRDVLRGNLVRVGRLYRNPQQPGVEYHLILFQGTIASVSVSDTDVQLTVVSDMYRGGTVGATRQVSSTCQFKFKDPATCGYSGGLTTCNKLYSSADGCSGRANQHRYGGVLRRNTQAQAASNAGGPPPVYQLLKTLSGTTETSLPQRTKLAANLDGGTRFVDDPGSDRSLIQVAGIESVVNVKLDHDAAGSITTITGSIEAGQNQLTVSSLGDFKLNHGVRVAGAGSGGADLITKITGVAGLVFTLQDNASTTVSGATVYHDDTAAINAGMAAAIASGKPLYFPPGKYLVGQITGGTNSLVIKGAGMRKSILKSRAASNAVLEVTSSSFHSILIENLGIEGAGISSGANNHGIYVHNNGGLVFTVTIRNVEVRECGGKGIWLLENFSTLLDGISISDCGGNGIEMEGDNSGALLNCYVHNMAAGKIGYRIYSGSPTLIGCNGVDTSSNADWGVFGKSTADGDDVDAYARVIMIGCNVEDFTRDGVRCKAGSYISHLSGTSFWAAAGHTTARAIKLDYVDTDTVGLLDAGCRFALKSGASWANGSPIHANNTPFVMMGNRVSGGKYFDTSLNSGAGLLVDLPYLSTARNTTTNKGSVYINSLAAGALDSDLVPTITNFRNLGSATYTLKEIHVGDKIALAAGATKILGANVELANGANPILKLTAGAVVARLQALDDSYMQIGTDTNHDIVFRTNNTDRWMVDANGTFRPVTDNARDIGYNGGRVKDLHIAGKVYNNVAQTVFVMVGTGSPEGVVTASPGAEYRRTDGGVGTTLYIKESGTGNTGWVAHAAGTSGANATLSNLSSPTAINQNLLFSSNNAFNIGNSGFTASPANVYVANSIVMANGATTVGGQSWTITGGANAELKLNDTTTGNVEARFKVFTNDRCIIGTITNHDLCLFANNADRWRVKGSGHFLPESSGSYDVGGTSNLARDIYLSRRIVAGGSTPSSSTGTGAGTSPSLSVSDAAFAVFIDLTTGSSPSANAKIFDLTMPTAAPNYYQAILQPANAAAAALNGNQRPFVSDADVTSTKVTIKSGSTGLAASTQYLWYVLIIAV